MKRGVWAFCVVTLCYIISVPVAGAVPMTWNVSFSASSFTTEEGPDPAPVDPVTGSFTITLDPTVTVVNQTAGIALSSLNIALGSALAYDFNASFQHLTVGGIETDAGGVLFIPSSDDFRISIGNLAGAPQFQGFAYSQTSVSGANLFRADTGSVNSVLVSQPVPEPSTVLLLAAGLVGVGVWRFRVGTDVA